MTDLPNVETLSPQPSDAELAWWDQHCRRKRWWKFVRRFVLGVSACSGYYAIRYAVDGHHFGRLYLIMTLIAGAAGAMAPRPNTELFDEMTTAIRDRRIREALRAPPRE